MSDDVFMSPSPDDLDDEFETGDLTEWTDVSAVDAAVSALTPDIATALQMLVRALDIPADGKPYRVSFETILHPDRIVASYFRVTHGPAV